MLPPENAVDKACVPIPSRRCRLTDVRGIVGEQVLLRIIVAESRTHDDRPLFAALVELLRSERLAGCTVVKGIAGFGHDRRVHTLALEVAAHHLPVVIEVVDAQERIDHVLPKIEALMAGGVITLERAQVIRYSHSGPPEPAPS
jgi:PII-like signaling protein